MAQELVSAAKSDNVAEVERILTDPKCNVNAYAGRLSPLQVTCSRGNLRIVKLLLKRGASLKTKDLFLDSARPPFLHAPKNARTHILKYFLELDNDLVQDTSDQKQTVLHFACENGDVASVDLLPKYNSKIYAKNTLKASPSQSCLLSASNKTGLEFSKMLVTAGNDIFRLAKHGPLEYFELLFDYYPESEFEKLYRNKTILGAAIDADKWEIATFIIEKIPDLANIKSRKVLPIQMGSYYFPGKLWYALTVHTLQKGLVWDQLSDQFSALFDEEYINSVKYLLYHHIRDCSRDIAGLRAARNRTLWCWVVKETDSFGGLLLKDLELTIRDYF
ncbi:hypothetical protein HK098_007701 [Nowakowskiella sp. JEL0407]|nr:hypothetical protein HK098_007701 [Nowakowskiella sp. JEL0407]